MRARAWIGIALGCAGLGCGGGGTPVVPDAGSTAIVGGDDAPACPDMTCRPGETLHACACVPTPREYETVRTSCAEISTPAETRTPLRDDCVDGPMGEPAALGCFTTGRRPPGTPRSVTLYGVADVFGNGPDATGMTVEVYREGADGALGELVGMATASGTDACAETEEKIDNGMPTGVTRQLGAYAVEGVPTETPLIVLTRGDAGLWKPLYTYNFQVLNEEVDESAPPSGACSGTPTGPRFQYRARVLSVNDYRTIPLTAGIAGGVPAGHGALAGEVHDCQDVRVSFAQVGVSPRPQSIVYFTDDADNPLPDISRVEGTAGLGLYAGLDLLPGPVDVSALGRIDGQLVSLGWYRARIFADSVTSVTLRGERPQQVATPAP